MNNALVELLGSMVSVDELADHFRADPHELIEYIELLGSEADYRYARLLTYRQQAEVLWELLQRAVRVA